MSLSKNKIPKMKNKIMEKLHDKSFWKHFGICAAIALVLGTVVSVFVSKGTTVNDMIIRYTEPPAEQLETEGNPVEIESPAEIQPETQPETQQETQPETQPETIGYIPEVQVNLPILSTNHRPWILSDLSDMFHTLSQKK